MEDTKLVLEEFRKELNYRLEEKGVSYKQAALSTRVTNSEMLKYLQGRSFPELWSIVLIADYLECSVNELFGYPKTSCFRAVDRDSVATIEFPNRDIFDDYFRDRLRMFMAYLEVSVAELSDRSGITEETIKMYLSVHRWVPRVTELLKLCDALNITPSDLLGY